MEKKFHLYFESVIKFLNSVTVKFDPFIDRLNDSYANKMDIDLDDPTTYPYYINVMGEYHSADEEIYITDFTNKTQILLTKENITNNINRDRYLTDFSLYTDLLKKYPTQKELIKNIFFPVKYTQEEIIAAPNFTLLGYDNSFLNERERDNIIFDLEDFLEYYNFRWYINTFNYEELYPLTHWSILWTILPLFLLYKKIQYIKTGNVDNFHLWEYLTSKGLKDYTGYLTSQQNIYFYRNIDFLIGNLGKILVNESLDEILLKPIGLSLQSKWIYHDLLTGIDDAHWNPISTNKGLKDINNILRIDSFNNLLNDIEEDGLDYDRYPAYKDDIQRDFTFTKHNHLITKYQEIITTLKDFKYHQFYIRFLSDMIFSLHKENRLDMTINLINDIDTNMMISITHEDALNLLYYTYYLKANIFSTYLPTITTSTIGINALERPTIIDDFRYQTEEYKISDYIDIDEILDMVTYINPGDMFDNKESLSEFINTRFDIWTQLIILKKSSYSRIENYAITNLINQLCIQETFTINNDLNTYADYFLLKPYLKEFILKYQSSPDYYDNLIYQIFSGFININDNIKNYVIADVIKDLQFQKMKQLFVQFNSYLIRLLDNVLMSQEYIALPTITTSLGEINTLISRSWNYPSKGFMLTMGEFDIHFYIENITWSDSIHNENSVYTLIINTYNPQNQELTYQVVCDDPTVIIEQTGDDHIWNITYGEYSINTEVVFTITVNNLFSIEHIVTDIKTVHDIRIPPVIESILWDIDVHDEGLPYVMTIDAIDPQSQDLTYEVTCDDVNVTITQTATPNIWDVVYPLYIDDTNVLYTVIVTNEDSLIDTGIDLKVVHTIEIPPVINTLTWDNDIHEEAGSYVLTIDATDPQSQDLTYNVFCSEANVTITQTGTPHIFDIIYPLYTEDTTMIFTAIVANEDLLTDEKTDIKVVANIEVSPVFNGFSWDNDIHVENMTYTLTIDATDPQSQDLTYTVICGDEDVIITQTGTLNIFDVTYPNYEVDTTIDFVINVTNEDDLLVGDTDTKIVADVKIAPVIDSFSWDNDIHVENTVYVLTINATDPQSQDLAYEVACNDIDVLITQTGIDNVWSITYPNYDVNTDVIFDILVTNEDNLTDTDTDTKNVADVKIAPVLDSFSWNNNTHIENMTYVLTITAHDPQSQDLIYEVVSDDVNTTITPTATPNIFDVVYPNYDLNTDVIFNMTVTNEDLLTDIDTDIKNVADVKIAPIFNSFSWNNDIHNDNNSYTLTIDAVDPQSQDLTYEVVCDDISVNISQNSTNHEIWHVTYPEYLSDTSVIFTMTVLNEDLLTDIDTDTKVVDDLGFPPVINTLTWDNDIHEEGNPYILTIDATDPQAFDLSYMVICDDTNIDLSKDINNPNIWTITYPLYEDNVDVVFTITVVNENTRFDTETIVKSVASVEIPPVIDSLVWNIDNHDEGSPYILTVNATDPQSQNLTYDVTCDDPNVTINQDITNEIIWNVLYPLYEADTTVIFTATITNEDLLTDIDTDNKLVSNMEIPPVIDSLIWNIDNHNENSSYVLTVNAHDPQSLDLTYEVVSDDVNITITPTATPNIFDVTYPSYSSDTTVVFTATVTNTDTLTDIDTDTKLVTNMELPPVIDSLNWNDGIHEEGKSYTLSILAHDLQNQDLTYDLSCNDVDVIITQDGNNDFIWEVVYPLFVIDTDITFTAIITNEDLLTDTEIDIKTVASISIPPVLDDFSWNEDTHYDNLNYVLTLTASDPQEQTLTYEVTCNDVNVVIVATGNPDVFNITYPNYTSDTDITFTMVVSNEDLLIDDDTDIKTVINVELPPVFNSFSWDDDTHDEAEAYVLTINASDPQSQDLTYGVICDDTNVTITPSAIPNIFDIVYPNYDADATVTYTMTVTNEDLLFVEDTDIKHVENAEAYPVIDSLIWNDDSHFERNTYTLTINATDPQSQDLTYSLVCDDEDVDIVQTANFNIWDVTYPNFDSNTNVVFTTTVTNEDLLFSIANDIKTVVHVEAAPVIDSFSWDNDDHREEETYELTINATDPQGFDLTYVVVCNDTNVIIAQTLIPNIFDVIYPEYNEATAVIFTMTVTNIDNLTDIETDNKLVANNGESPVIDSFFWDNDVHGENSSYVLTINASDPNSQDLTYDVVCDDITVAITPTATPNIFDIVYLDYDENTDITYTMTVTNEDLMTDIKIDIRTVLYIPVPGERGLFGGGYMIHRETIDYVTISTTGTTSDFGNLINPGKYQLMACSNGINDRGIFSGGLTLTDEMEYVTISSIGNGMTFGELILTCTQAASFSNNINERGIVAGGYQPTVNLIQYFTISTPGNANNFGDLDATKYQFDGTSNGINERGITAGGRNTSDVIEYITINTPGDATDFGDIITAKYGLTVTSNNTNDRAIIAGGFNSKTIEYVTISSLGNGMTFGEFPENRRQLSATSNGTNERGVFGGGYYISSTSDIIEYITINTTGSSVDFGNLSESVYDLAACSDG